MRLPLTSKLDRRSRGPMADTTEGPVVGKLINKGRLNYFAGIPYAAPPLGNLRWRPPAPPEIRDAPLSCARPGPMPLQRAQEMERLYTTLVDGLGLSPARKKTLAALLKAAPRKTSEDCLTLSVRAPAGASDLPVMVWIHGGDHTDGAGSEPIYASKALPERGCVLVNINYRLGLMAFLAHPDLAKESPDSVSGNYGLLDQIEALQWVQKNIRNFGGDPERVTIFGESAGGEAVLNLMTSPLARGLFGAAIAQSPSDSGRWLHLDESVLTLKSASQAGADFCRSIVGDVADPIAAMRELGAEELYDRYRSDQEAGRYFFPVVDGKTLPTTPMTAFSMGTQAPVPLLIGYNRDEGSLFADYMHPAGGEFGPVPETGLSAEALANTLRVSYGSAEAAQKLLDLYPGLETGDRGARLDHCRDHMFAVHVDHAARAHSAAGHSTFRYFFQSVPASKTQTLGAFHGAEILHVMDTVFPLVPVPSDAHLLTREMGDRWFAFAATHRPDSPGRVAWPPYETDNARQMVFDRPKSQVMECEESERLDLMRQRIAYLNSVTDFAAPIDLRTQTTRSGS